MNDPKDVSVETTEGGSISITGIRLWKIVTVVGFGDNRQLVRLCSGVFLFK